MRRVLSLLTAAMLAQLQACRSANDSVADDPIPSDPGTTPLPPLDPSWKAGPMMQIFLRAYKDSNGDGEGDLRGLIEKLDYLQDLGIRGILLLPINPNRDRDHGYSTLDYRDVAPDYGTLQDLDDLLVAAHERDIGIMMDFVGLYSSHLHPWFLSALESTESPWRDWYVWSETHPDGEWVGQSGDDPWHETPTGYYYGFVHPDCPNFNWNNPDVRAYHADTLRFWMDRGIDGFRVDAAELLAGGQPYAWDGWSNTVPWIVELGNVVREYDNRLLIAEAPGHPWEYGMRAVAGNAFAFAVVYSTVGEDGELIEFQGQTAVGAAVLGPTKLERASELTGSLAHYPLVHPMGELSTLLANHDRFAGIRLWDQFGGDVPGYRLAAATLLLMPGTPFIYYGEEVGMQETILPLNRPESDHHQRGVMSWTGDLANAGFSSASALNGPAAIADPNDKYLAPVSNVATHNVEDEAVDPDSLLNHYKKLIALRRDSAALNRGAYRLLGLNGPSLVFERAHGGQILLVAINYAAGEATLSLDYQEPKAQVVAGTYDSSFYVYGATSSVVTITSGADTLTLPPQSVQVFQLTGTGSMPPLGDVSLWMGFLTDYETETPMAYLPPDMYSVTKNLDAVEYLFKVSGPSWMPSLGVARPWASAHQWDAQIDQPFVLEPTNGHLPLDSMEALDYIRFTPPAAGEYQFSLDVDNPLLPVLTVSAGSQ